MNFCSECISKSLQLDESAKKKEFAECGVIDSLCIAYDKCQKIAESTRRDLFHLRDFVYFLRFLGQRATRGNKFEVYFTISQGRH